MATTTITPFTAANIASAVLSLSKRAWKLGAALSKLDRYAEVADTTVKALTEGVKSLGNECDLVYAELETVMNGNEIGQPLLYDVDDRIWDCLETQVEDTSQTVQELETFVGRVVGEQSRSLSWAQRQRTLHQNKPQITSIRSSICRNTDNLHTILLLINTVITHLAPGRVDQRLSQELDKLRDMIEKLHKSSEADPQSRSSRSEATLIQRAREVVAKGTTMYETSLSPRTFRRGQEANNVRVAEWVDALESIRQEQHDVTMSLSSAQRFAQQEAGDGVAGDFDDDLDTDIAKAALDTGAKAFAAQEWAEADSLLQEALQLLQHLSRQQRAFCDIFSLHYKLAICVYHNQEPADAEVALRSLVEHSASSDENRNCIHNARHLLALLYIRIGQVDRARSECEKALQGRRRSLGKESEASLESTALMAHIYFMLNNRPRAKSYLAMIPEARRETVVKSVEDSLGTDVKQLDFSSSRTRSTFEDPDVASKLIESRLSGSTLGLAIEEISYRPLSAMVKTPAASIRQPFQHIPSNQTVASLSPSTAESDARAMEEERPNFNDYADEVAFDVASLSLSEPPEASETPMARYMSRKEVLEKIGCHPKDSIEEAVCNGDHSALAKLLDKRKDFWRSKLRKRVRPERLTALHFAALFGEMDIARSLLGASFNINDVPYGYTTSLSPLKIAIGARQVDMVEFLIARGAKPSDPDTWSTLAGQLMSRSWLVKTLSEVEKEFVPNRIIAILSILLRHGWDVNEPFEPSGATLLHQAVTFWTGSYRWDLTLRASITTFLQERGANPFQANKEGKTPYDMALASGDGDLLMILGQHSGAKGLGNVLEEPVELSV